MFVDASALCAIFLDEPDGPDFHRRIAEAASPLVSPIVVWETCRALHRETGSDPLLIQSRVLAFLDGLHVSTVEVGRPEQSEAIGAYSDFGKGRHPAKLNMGDCFAYACARTNGVPLLFKGGDFSRTDIEAA